MADNIVQSLFGLDPYQTQMQQQDALRQQAAAYANMAPAQRAAMSLYQAGGQLAGAGAEGLFGMVNPAVAKAQATEQAMMGLDMSSPQSILARANSVTDPRLRIQLQLLAQQAAERQLDAQKKQAEIELSKAHVKYYGAGGSAGGSNQMMAKIAIARNDAMKIGADLGLKGQDLMDFVDAAEQKVRAIYAGTQPSDGLVQLSPTTKMDIVGGITPAMKEAMYQDAVSRNDLEAARAIAALSPSRLDVLPKSKAEVAGDIERAKQGEKVVETTTPSGTAAFARAGESIGQAPAQFSPQVKGAVAQAEATGKEVGQVAGKAQTELAGMDEKQSLAFTQVDELLRHKGFSSVVGATMVPGMRFIPGTKEADFMSRLEQIKGGAFMEAYKVLKGGGQITEMEGVKATAAMNRMSISTSEAEFRAAAKDFKDAVTVGFNKLRAQAALSRSQAAQSGVEVWERGPDGKLRRVR